MSLLNMLIPLAAQITQITPPQIGVLSPGPSILVVVNNKFSTLEIGPGLRLEPTPIGYRLYTSATLPPTVFLQRTKLDRFANGNYAPCSGMLHRNGVLQDEEDYTVAADGSIATRTPWGLDEKASCLTVGWPAPK